MRKIVISMEQINRKFQKKDLRNYYVLFIEVSNLQIYSQFYDITISEKIIKAIYNDLINIFGRNSVFLYSSDVIIVFQEFENKVIVDRVKRYDEQRRLAQNVYNYICNRHYSLGALDHYYQASLTIGVGSKGLIEKENTISSIIRLAHFAMIKAKEKNTHILVANDELRILKLDLDTFNKEIEQGFKLDEFQPFFMPNIDPQTMQIVGCESLVRWTKDKYRVIEASKFYQIAIEKNLIEKIDGRVIVKTFQAFHDWKQSGLINDDFRITINLSKNTLIKFPLKEILDSVSLYRINPSNIEFDITLDNGLTKEEINATTKLKKHGFKVACDVLGSTNISLPILSEIDVATIKFGYLSQGFSKDAESAKKLYTALIRVAKTLDYMVMTKGIENKNELEFVRKLGVDLVQGYYFTKPLNKDGFELFLNKYKEGVF
ncbi:MAG TPA: EAL domain-containing protein [Acholeplasmataceae bacterium]|jgi:EAL domain-containing protein (putative c-di-GMP-specific phosphodiesterase class I)|nr:EAL domain-containing protein [Acholeplasmataceae bacterium]